MVVPSTLEPFLQDISCKNLHSEQSMYRVRTQNKRRLQQLRIFQQHNLRSFHYLSHTSQLRTDGTNQLLRRMTAQLDNPCTYYYLARSRKYLLDTVYT